jgi:antitoxin VapB
MPVARSRTFRSGNSEALRLPRNVAFRDDVELVLVPSGNVMTIYPAATSLAEMLATLRSAQAIVHRATVVTMNPDDFADIPGLDVLTW